MISCSGDYGDGVVMCIYLSGSDFYEECVPVEFVQDVFGKNPNNICGECPVIPTESPTFSPTDEPTDEPTPEPTNEPTFNPTYGFQCEGKVNHGQDQGYLKHKMNGGQDCNCVSYQISQYFLLFVSLQGDQFACSSDGHVFVCHEGETLCVTQEDAIILILSGAYCGQCPTFYCDSNHFPCQNGKVLICHM